MGVWLGVGVVGCGWVCVGVIGCVCVGGGGGWSINGGVQANALSENTRVQLLSEQLEQPPRQLKVAYGLHVASCADWLPPRQLRDEVGPRDVLLLRLAPQEPAHRIARRKLLQLVHVVNNCWDSEEISNAVAGEEVKACGGEDVGEKCTRVFPCFCLDGAALCRRVPGTEMRLCMRAGGGMGVLVSVGVG
jgi:hypothetical protein